MKYLTILLAIFVLKTCESTENLVTKSNLQDMTLSGLYSVSIIGKKSISNNLTIEFDAATNKVSGFSGCNRYFGSYTISKDALKIGPIASTRKYCIGEANDIEFEFQNALSKVNRFKILDNTISLLVNDEVLITANKQINENTQEKLDYSITYTAISRGFYKTVEFQNDSITYQNNRTDKPETIKCKSDDLEKINNLLNNLNLSSLSKLDAPTKAHQYDGAAGATLKIQHSGKTYQTVTFDHGNPPSQISGLINLILALSESI